MLLMMIFLDVHTWPTPPPPPHTHTHTLTHTHTHTHTHGSCLRLFLSILICRNLTVFIPLRVSFLQTFCRRIARCAQSVHFMVAERALQFWNNPVFMRQVSCVCITACVRAHRDAMLIAHPHTEVRVHAHVHTHTHTHTHLH